MLDKHLIAKTAPIANKENIVHWKNYRVTVLADRLFRIERSENCRFRDAATQVVWFRNMEKQRFTVTKDDAEASIKTHACKIILKEAREDCRIELNGKEQGYRITHKQLLNNANIKLTLKKEAK